MPFEMFQFGDFKKVLKSLRMEKDVKVTLQYIDDVMYGCRYKREIFRQAMEETGWREGNLTIIEGRRYQFKGCKSGIAIEANLSVYEYVLEGLFRLQIGYDKGLIKAGILLLNTERGARSPYGDTAKMIQEEIELLKPTISLPVAVVLFDIGTPGIYLDAEDTGLNDTAAVNAESVQVS